MMAESEVAMSSQPQPLQDVEYEGNINGLNNCLPAPSQPVSMSEGESKVEAESQSEVGELKEVKPEAGIPEENFLVNLNNDAKHSKGETEEPQDDSSNGSTTPVTESENSSPVSDLSEKSISDKAEFPLETSSTKEEKVKALAVPQKLRLKYSRDQLLKLMDVPASRLWPEYFDISFKKSQGGKFDLERWMRAKQDNQRTGGTGTLNATLSSLTNGSGGISSQSSERPPDLEIKRSRDPRERVKVEEDGISLSPQRRSFGTGCHIPQQGLNFGSGSDSTSDRSRESHREMPVRSRIGSGRIPRREEPELNLDRRRERDSNDRDMDTRRDHNKDWRSKNDSRHDRDDRHLDRRRRFFEEEEKRSDRRDLRDSRRFNDHRRSSTSKDIEEETPEWFTGGPSSQNEFIELVGFDEPHHEEKNNNGGSGKNSRSNTPVIIEKEEPVESKLEEAQMKIEKPIVVEPSNDQDAIQFNVEDYLGSILNLGPDEIVVHGGSGASRLKQLFNRESPPVEEQHHNTTDLRRSPPGKDKFPQLSNLLSFVEPVIRIPSPTSQLDFSHFFAPISPADKTSGDAIVEMLQQANSKNTVQQPIMVGSGRLPPPSVKELLMGGKGQSLEEIEANLRKGQQQPPMCGLHSMPRMNAAFNPGKQQSVQAQMRQQTISSQQNPFSDFFSQISEGQRKMVAERNQESDNILEKLLKDTAVNSVMMSNKPSMPNNAPTESELIARLIKSGNANMNAGGSVPPISSMNGPPPRPQPSLASLNLPTHNLSPNPPSTLPQHSPSRSHLMAHHQQHHHHPQQQHQQQHQQQQLPSTTNSDIFMKLIQNQHQQMQQQQKKQMLHPAYQQQQQSQQQQLQHDPIKQLLGGMNNLGLNSTQQSQDTVSRDVQSLFQRVVNGQVTDAQLIAQLNSGNLTHQQRDAIATVLKLINCCPPSLMPPRTNLTPSPTPQSMMGGGLTLGTTTTPSLSPRVASPNPEGSNMLAPHMMPQTRLSPLMFGGSSGPHRTPSHQELVRHTQNILQRALIKQELEKARLKHLERETERTRSPNPAATSLQNGPTSISHNTSAMNRANQDCSPTKGAKCHSPLAFTPTSVMRKMTAEKDRLEKDHKHDGVSEADKAREQHVNRMSNQAQNHALHHPGMNLKVDKRVCKVPSPLPSGNSMLGPRAQMMVSGGHTNPMMNMGGPPPHGLGPSQRPMSLQPNMPIGRPNQHNVNSIRALQHVQAQASLSQMRRNQMPPPHVGGMNQHHPMQNRLPNAQTNPMQHLVIGNNNNYKQQGENNLQVPRPVSSSSSQNNSPVNNLMNLFGRDVMAKVQAGAMPELPGEKVLSLEEVERLQQTQAVPN